MTDKKTEYIEIRGAGAHNLRNVSLAEIDFLRIFDAIEQISLLRFCFRSQSAFYAEHKIWRQNSRKLVRRLW